MANDTKAKKKEKGGFIRLLTVLFIILIIIAIFGGVFYFIIANNIGGVTEKNYSAIKKIPILNLALPAPPDPLNPIYMTNEEIRRQYIVYQDDNAELSTKLEEAEAQIAEYRVFKDEYDALMQEAQAKKDDLDSREARIKEKELEQKELQLQIDKLIAQGDTAAFADYFEKLEPENAALIYEQVMKDQQLDAEIKKFAQIYAEMKSDAAAQIFEQLGNSQIDMIAETLKAMNRTSASEILESMTPSFAARVTQRLDELYKGN